MRRRDLILLRNATWAGAALVILVGFVLSAPAAGCGQGTNPCPSGSAVYAYGLGQVLVQVVLEAGLALALVVVGIVAHLRARTMS